MGGFSQTVSDSSLQKLYTAALLCVPGFSHTGLVGDSKLELSCFMNEYLHSAAAGWTIDGPMELRHGCNGPCITGYDIVLSVAWIISFLLVSELISLSISMGYQRYNNLSGVNPLPTIRNS